MAISSGEEAWYVVTDLPSGPSSVVGVTLWQRARASTTSRTRDPISRRVRVPAVFAGLTSDEGVMSMAREVMLAGVELEKPCLT